ncbi:DUF1542 domain-containing protein [Limosilactobacillus reuteri]|uniref:DUF1542 domain-containing protein n=1 Tax=Limosilactobacillus reuteri TaxID=1598 RepID=UPI000B988EC5|nr:DUF1542 domain-containing protein [Limosilactobacillus reuteri]OYT07183.1 YSIRK signal domain/LPXTG anchor domain surface protein [Limosilactobacillus reuteri]OYT07327.1 YSIRK signal domain/LPXTG anchor domain surface protein [Limosilactobacillus reuteri]OYT07924.1 YSIRK signal domain/LPXTG anchor domain surface protein [Limosilactobacillus reuteri]
MVSKNNKKLIAEKNRRNEKQRFAIRKLNIGVASVLLGITFSIYGGGQAVAHADTANASDQVAASDTGDNSLADKSEVALSNTALNASQSSTSATSANGAVQSQSSANSQPAATASDNAVASSAAVEATKDQSTAENQPSASQEVQTPAQAQPVVQENGSGDTSLDATRQVLNAVARRNSNSAGAIHLTSFAAVPASTPAVATSDATAEDTNAVTVTDAQGLIDAIQKGSATTINVANDINLAKVTDYNYTYIRKINTRDFTIKSATNGVKHTIDFSGYVFNMSTPNTVTFKDLDIYARSYWGVVYNAGGYVYDNVNFTGSQLIYTASNTDATVTFKNKVTATTVGSYTSPIDGKSRSSQGGDTQQILQFEGGTNQIIFDENSDVTLGTTNSNVLEVDRGTATIDVKNGANVTINPHSKGNPENRNGIGTGSIARAIASNANTTINVDKGANLTINTEKASGDSDVAGALYLNSDATLNVNGDLNINSTGTPSTKNDGYPVYIAGNAAINVGNGGKFNLSATNTGSYNDNLMSISGKGTVKLAPHSNFKISGDGTGALTAINLSSGSTFTSDQPDLFTIDLSANTSTGKSLIKNGTIHFTRVKTVTDGNESQPLGKIDVTYDRNGNATSYTITAQDENTVKQVGEGLANKNLIDLVKAGEDVTLSNLHLSKNNVLTGTVASSGSNNPVYVTVTVGGVSTNVPVAGNYTVYTNTNGTVTSNNVDYAAQTASTGGNFSIDLSKLASSLTDDAQVAVNATKDFVEAAQTESVAALRALNTTTLQELVDDAPTEEAKPSYYNATTEAQKAYIDAISTGKDILANPNNYDQVDVDDAVNAIQTAQKALTGKETNKTELQDAIDQASTVESSNNYTNADSNLQKAYTDAISAGQTVLSNDNATQTEVDNALTTINNAKDALNGDAKKAASKEALQKAVAEAPTVKSDDAAYYNGSDEAKAAYDKAISDGQTVLDNSDATATQITDALNAINTAKGNLKGEATDKSVLQKVVDNSATVKESNNYTNADETQKTAYDNAVTAAQTVLDKTNATQAEVNQALQDLETANNNLNGDAKTEAANKAALEAAVKDAPNVRNTPAYYNGSKEAQTAYNNAINAGQAVLNETNPFASDVKNALDAINAAKDNLKGETTSTEALETALTNANNAKETGNYANADQANQEALNNAINAGQEILKNTNATQAEVDNAAKAITDAINGLNGDTNLANAKNAATEDIQKALDTKTTEITDATNIDQATKDQLIADAKKAAEDANTAINQATNANAVNTAKTEGITKINNVKIPSLDDAKTNAAKEIDQALTDKTKEITDAENIDQTTKDQLIKEATDAATTAKDAIEKSTTNDEATKAGQAGVDAINNVKVPSVTDSQNAAKDAIDDALNAKTKEINDANNIDQTTKDQLIKEATDAANNAKEAIDKATTADAIKTVQDEGTTNINNVTVPSLEDAKKAANKAVDDALTAQTEVINKADNLSDAEKKDLIDQATNEANKAKDNIETATTNNEATKAGQAGVDAIKKIVPTSLDTVKSDANKAIDDALTKKLEEINSANALTTDEKNALTQEANTAADKAKKEITKATTNDSVIEAQNNGVTAIDGIKVPTESAVKEAAKKAVAEAAEAKNNAINASNLTAEEKAALKQKVTEAENAADQAIDNATTNAAVTEAQNNGIKAINGIEVTTSTAKEAAKKAVAEAATAKNNAIDSSNLTAEEKAALKQEVTEAQNAADQAIDNATTNAAVTEAQNSGVNAINGIKVPITSTTKEQATTDLNKAVDEAKKAIDQDSNLTDKEKQAVKDQIDSDAKTAQDAINNAKTNDDVKKAVDAGTLVIDKDVANAAIDNAVAGKKAEISNSPLTDEEKTALNNEVDQKANTAKEAINAATTPEAVTSAQDNGIKNINDTEVSSESTTKQAAKEAVAKAVDEKNAAIDSSNLTAEEKAALKQKVTEAQNAADQAIDNATTNAAVTEAKNNGVSAIDHIKVPTTSANKEKAITDLNTAVDEAKKAIDQDSNLTDEEKRAAKDQIDAAAKTAQEAINNAKTNDDVKKAVDAGTLVIDKDVANAAIDNAVAGKLKEIQDPLTTDEKQAYTDLINSEANNAKQNIANATTVEEVTTAQNSGVDAINKIEVPITSTVKDDAIKAIDKALQNKTDEINNASNINPQEKTDLINQATEAANVAKNNINNATTNADVDTAQTNGEKAIADVTVPNLSDVKKESIDLVNKALDAKTAEINNASNLSQDEKQSLINDATNAATEAINNINESQTNDDAKAAATTGVQNIENVTIPTLDDAKKNANQAIDDALNSKVNEINNASNLNDTEKQKLVDQATEAATTAKNNVENATTNDAARDAANAGIDNIKGIRFTSLEDAKKVANTAIDNALQVKTDEINNASNLSTEEKQDLINQASEAAKNAKDNINNATTNDAVTDAQNKGIADIANVTVPSLAQAKQDAINAIKQVQDAKNKQISATSNLSAKEQKELSDQVDKIANDAIAKINDAATTTNDAVTAIRDDAIKQITDLFIPTLDGAQTDALNAIESAKNAKLNDINNAVHLTDQEKQVLVDQTNKAADEATKAINAAQTNDEVKSAETAGLDIINNITIPTLVQKQQEAIEELNAARDAKNSAIDNAADLTTDEKNSLKDKVQAEYSNAVSNITSATTDEAVTTAKENGIAAIKDIQIPTKSAAKEQATTDLNTAVDDAKKAIDQDSNLTDEEKQAAKDQIDSDAKKAQEAIDNAKTDDEVNSAVDNGKLAIDKDIANAAIDNAAAGKKAEIAKSPLTDEEKTALNNKVAQKAQDAKEAINDATTPEAVTTAQENGIKKINDTEVPTESAAKEAAKKAVAEAAETKNNAIDSSNLTNEEKTALKQEVTDAQNAANTAIDNATTNAAVTEAEDNGIKAINGIEVPTKSAAKEQATTDLNDAVDDAKKAIDQDSNLTDEEKQAAKDQIDSDAKKAQEVIDNAKTADEVKTAVDNGQLAIDKDVANAAIDNAVAGKKAEIAKAPLTTDEAKALNDLVDQEAKAAKKAIDSATTIPAVEDAKNTGVAAINDIAVPTTSSTKDQANQTIDDALANKTKEINDATNLSNKQKQDLIDEATEEAAKAKENIKNATSNEAVNKATTDGVDAIANVTVPSLDDAKKDASQLIDDVLKQKEAEINNASHLTDQEKQDLIHQAQNAADEAKDKINQATTNDDVATERDAGAEKIANIAVPSLDDAKDKATKAIDDALADKTKEINEQTHLSDQEKNDLIKQITDIADNAKDKINNDSNDAEVAKDEKEGIDAIVDTKVPGLEDHKQNAIKSLDEAKSTKLAQIDEAGHLTADEKANLTQQVDAEYNKALDNINKATTNDDADKASADGVEAILNIAVPSLNEKKQDSIDALNEVRDAKKEEINNANNLNQDEKDELTKQVDQIADNAINAINGAKDDQTAKNAENKGIQDILDVKVPSLDEVKTNAKQAIADALESKTNEINAASNLDSATKQELINRANAEADTAIEKIDQATSNDQALAASQAGVDKILGIEVPTLADAKQSAIDAINDALKQKETEINNALQLTSDEKQNLINQVNSIADNAKNAINNATTNQSVEETKNAGIEKINAINVPTTSATKDEAIKAIDDALTNKVNEINNATNITADEKANLIDEANNAANTAKDNITKATSDSEVATATTDGINAIANVTVPSLETAKDQAKNLIDDVLNEKKNEINNADNLSNSQKQDLINQATDEADQAKKNIDNATTNNDVQTAEDNGAQAIENVTVPSLDEAKKASTKVIDEVLKEKTAEINAATNLSNTEKDALIKDATTAANTAKDNIAKATTNDAVKDAETDGVKAILDIKVPGREDQQKDAIAALDRALADKVSEIDNANNLSETTKQDLKQQAQAAYTTAVDNVNNAQTSAEINAARDNGVQAILDITVPTLTDAQDASITAVEQVRDAKKTQIEAAKNLTETQKEALKNQVDKIADKAIDNIKNATTDATVKDAETAGINEILNVTIPTLDAAKSDAKQAIADALTAKTAEINAAQNLTDAEKQKLIDQAQTEAAAANKNIDAATTNDAAELAAKNGVQAILDIQVPTVEETRDQAKKNVDNALNSKKEEINNSNLSPAAKEALINEAEQAAENARTAIDNATTASAIGEAEAAGIAAIENIKVSNASTESDNSSNHQTNTETPTEGNSASQDNNNATQAPVQGNNTQADLTGSHGTNLTIGQQTEKAADTNSKETLPQTGNETERGLSIAGLAIASLLGLFGLSGLGKKRD